MRDANEFTYWSALDLENELTVAEGKDGGRDSQGVWDGRGHTAVFNMDNQQGPAAQHGDHMAAWMGGTFSKYIYVYNWVPLLSIWSCHDLVNSCCC